MGFEGDAGAVVDVVEEEGDVLEVFVDGAAGALPVAVVVDDHGAVEGEAGVEVEEFVFGGFVPVGVEAEEGDGLGDELGDGVFDFALDHFDAGGGVAGAVDGLVDVIEGGAGLDEGVIEDGGGGLAEDVDVLIGGGGHAFVGVVEVEVAVGDAEVEEGECDGHHGAAAPDAALDEVAGDLGGDDVADGLDEFALAEDGGHGEGLDTLEDGVILGVHFAGRAGGDFAEGAIDELLGCEVLGR